MLDSETPPPSSRIRMERKEERRLVAGSELVFELEDGGGDEGGEMVM